MNDFKIIWISLISYNRLRIYEIISKLQKQSNDESSYKNDLNSKSVFIFGHFIHIYVG